MATMISALLLLATMDPTTTVRHCDRIEINTVWRCERDWMGGAGEWEPQITQVIYWRWQDGDTRVAGWRLLKGDPPVRHGSGYIDRTVQGGRSYEIHAPMLVETNTKHDPEMVDRKTWPEEARRGWW